MKQELPRLREAKLHLAEQSQVDSTRRCRCRCRRCRRWHNRVWTVSRPLTSSKKKKITLSLHICIRQIAGPNIQADRGILSWFFMVPCTQGLSLLLHRPTNFKWSIPFPKGDCSCSIHQAIYSGKQVNCDSQDSEAQEPQT